MRASAERRDLVSERPSGRPVRMILERICKGIAALDAMLWEEWQDRYYSFDHAWNTSAGQRMASMRNGEGDEWFMVFDSAARS